MVEDNVIINRLKLYDQVWSTPMTHLAAKYGLSDVGMRKICKKLNIPTPQAGHWAKIEAGKNIAKPPLPPLKYGERETYELKPRQEYESQALKKKDPDNLDPKIAALFAEIEEASKPVAVPERLTSPHPLVKMTLDALENKKPDRHGTMRTWRKKYLDIRVSPSSLKRALRIMDTIIKAIEERSCKVEIGKGDAAGTYLLIHGYKLEFALTEKINGVPHIPTVAEIERQKEYSWDSPPRFDYKPSGLLTLRIDEYGAQGYRKSWSDGKKHRLEDLLGDFVMGAFKIAIIAKEENQERERKSAEERRLREEREAQRLAAEKFIEELEEKAESWNKSQQIQSFVERVEKEYAGQPLSPAAHEKLKLWLGKAKRYADWLNPLSNGFPLEEDPD